MFFFFQAEDGIRDFHVTGVQTCALPIFGASGLPTTYPPSGVTAAVSAQLCPAGASIGSIGSPLTAASSPDPQAARASASGAAMAVKRTRRKFGIRRFLCREGEANPMGGPGRSTGRLYPQLCPRFKAVRLEEFLELALERCPRVGARHDHAVYREAGRPADSGPSPLLRGNLGEATG